MSQTAKKKIYKSSITGHPVTKAYADANPDTTYSTHQPTGIKRPRKPKGEQTASEPEPQVKVETTADEQKKTDEEQS